VTKEDFTILATPLPSLQVIRAIASEVNGRAHGLIRSSLAFNSAQDSKEK
jgi:hypothetical protein